LGASGSPHARTGEWLSLTELLVFGSDSLVGSHFVEFTRHPVRAAGRVDPRPSGIAVSGFEVVDLQDPGRVRSVIHASSAETVINFAAATEVDKVEGERPADHPETASGPAFTVNVLAAAEMARTAHEGGRQFITLSTDFVFDGLSGPYGESARPSAWSPQVGWYGWTKGEGERRVLEADPRAAVVRISYPYRTRFAGKTDFARNIVARRKAGTLPPLFTDQVITPTWIPDVSRALEYIIDRRESGCFHVASPERTTPWEFGESLIGTLEGRAPGLPQSSMADYLARGGVTPRPRSGGLTVERLLEGGVALTGWRAGIAAFHAAGADA
jgi:dTDP-4-dehydrorhamnose reductase